jgi:hypothetical protein
MHSLKLEGSSPLHLSDLSHLSVFQLAVLMEQYVDRILHTELGNLVVQTQAAKHPETLNWCIWVRVNGHKYFSCELKEHLQDWFPLESMIAEIKLCV